MSNLCICLVQLSCLPFARCACKKAELSSEELARLQSLQEVSQAKRRMNPGPVRPEHPWDAGGLWPQPSRPLGCWKR